MRIDVRKETNLFMCFHDLQLGQPIRLLLKYTKTEFEDVRYEQGDGGYILSTFVCVCLDLHFY